MTAPRLIADARAAIRSHSLAGDLIWRFQWAAGDMEQPSNYNAMANMLALGGPTRSGNISDDAPPRQIGAAHRASRIDDILLKLPERDRALLYALFGSDDGDLDLLLSCLPLAVHTWQSRVSQGVTAPLGEWFRRISAPTARPLARDTAERIRAQAVRLAANAAETYASLDRLRVFHSRRH
jgi:hypothetical protein